MIHDDDHWVNLTDKQLQPWLAELPSWSESYRRLAEVLASRRLGARVLLRRGVELGEVVALRHAPAVPLISSPLRSVVDQCLEDIFSNPGVSCVACFDYTSGMPPELAHTVAQLGGTFELVSDSPIIYLPRGSQGLQRLELFRDPNYSPIVGLAELHKIESMTDMFCYVFDGDTIMYVTSSPR